jgi:hypothetical protein
MIGERAKRLSESWLCQARVLSRAKTTPEPDARALQAPWTTEWFSGLFRQLLVAANRCSLELLDKSGGGGATPRLKFWLREKTNFKIDVTGSAFTDRSPSGSFGQRGV